MRALAQQLAESSDQPGVIMNAKDALQVMDFEEAARRVLPPFHFGEPAGQLTSHAGSVPRHGNLLERLGRLSHECHRVLRIAALPHNERLGAVRPRVPELDPW